MSDNVGLSTPRGSGTSGFVQRNRAHIRPRDRAAPYPPKDSDALRHRQRQPDKEILEHNRKRALYAEQFKYERELLDELEKEEEELNEEERKTFETNMTEFKRKQLEREDAGKGNDKPRKQFQGHQVHEMADAKQKEMDKMGRALKISSNYEEGSHWRRQEERMKSSLERDDKDDKPRQRE